MKGRVRYFALCSMLAACEPAMRDVDSVSVVVSAPASDARPAAPVPIDVVGTAASAFASASGRAPVDPDEQLKQNLIRKLEEVERDAKKPRPTSSAACPPSDPLCG
jgi:hypothetical protein